MYTGSSTYNSPAAVSSSLPRCLSICPRHNICVWPHDPVEPLGSSHCRMVDVDFRPPFCIAMVPKRECYCCSKLQRIHFMVKWRHVTSQTEPPRRHMTSQTEPPRRHMTSQTKPLGRHMTSQTNHAGATTLWNYDKIIKDTAWGYTCFFTNLTSQGLVNPGWQVPSASTSILNVIQTTTDIQ